jgi:hypothetical protein
VPDHLRVSEVCNIQYRESSLDHNICVRLDRDPRHCSLIMTHDHYAMPNSAFQAPAV